MGWRLGLTPGVFLGEAESNTEFEQVFDGMQRGCALPFSFVGISFEPPWAQQ
jgi:hypothetical protein